jgi:hypothetical protein
MSISAADKATKNTLSQMTTEKAKPAPLSQVTTENKKDDVEIKNICPHCGKAI